MNSEKTSLRIRYEYEKETNTPIHYVHGVCGGINPYGEIELNFYSESEKLPAYSERLISPDGGFEHEITPYDENCKTVVRNVHSRLLLNYHTAKAVAEWLEDRIRLMEEEGERSESLLFESDPDIHQ